jgi:hypothetical protein
MIINTYSINSVSLPIAGIDSGDYVTLSFTHTMSGDNILLSVQNTETGSKYISFQLDGSVFKYAGQYSYVANSTYKGVCVVYSEGSNVVVYDLNNLRDNVIYN